MKAPENVHGHSCLVCLRSYFVTPKECSNRLNVCPKCYPKYAKTKTKETL